MAFYEDRKNVDNYIKMAEGYDGRDLIAVLKQHLPAGATVLELGMGPGTDTDLLGQTYTVTGSDFSSVFLDVYREKHPAADLLQLDAATLDTDRTFDCIYSNKVLQHLSKLDLKRSFARQRELLNAEGLLMHSFWYGDKEEEYHGLRSVYYTEEEMLEIIGRGLAVEAIARYSEMGDSDSFYILLRKA